MTSADIRLRRSSDPYGRYYTREFVGSALINAIAAREPQIVVDLGAGDGVLSRAAIARWKHTNLITIDISQSPVIPSRDASKLVYHKHYAADALGRDFFEQIDLKPGSADIAISNPPYITPAWRNNFKRILEEAGLPLDSRHSLEVTADILFLAQSLRLLRANGHAGLIVPDSFISGEKLLTMRRALLSENKVLKVIKLPKNAFSRTDAQAHIIVLEKGNKRGGLISLQRLSEAGTASKELLIEPKDGVQRLDYDYHLNRSSAKSQHFASTTHTPLSSIALIRRGSINKTRADKEGLPVLHTTDISRGTRLSIARNKLCPKELLQSSLVTAQIGDILVGRVGRNLSDKIAIIESGSAIASDCLFVISAEPQHRDIIFSALTSEKGKEWIDSTCRGVGAKHISKADIASFPLLL